MSRKCCPLYCGFDGDLREVNSGIISAYICPACLAVAFDGGIVLYQRSHVDVGRMVFPTIDALRRSAFTDPLTQIRSSLFFFKRLDAEISAADHKYFLSIVAFSVDIDGLYKSAGARGGDAMLQGIAASLLGAVRTGDDLARVDAGVFGLLVRNADARTALSFAERALKSIGSEFCDHNGVRRSVGIHCASAMVSAEAPMDAWQSVVSELKR